MNYIKRLIGLPGETIAICQGDLYVLDPELLGLSYPDDRAKARTPQELWQLEYMHINDPKALDRWENGAFKIIRKGPDQILAMKRIVYDNDHPPRDLPGEEWQRWLGDGWKDAGGHGFRHEGGPSWLRYRHLLRHSDPNDKGPPKKQLITDFLGYNSWEGGIHGRHPAENWVGDLVLDCEAVVEKAEGELVLELSRGPDRFQARFDLGSGTCSLLRVSDGKETELARKPTRLNKAGTYRLRFANVDRRLTVWVDKELPFGDEGNYDGLRDPAPTENDLQPASIAASSGVTVRGLKLWRDTYYTVNTGAGPSGGDIALDPGDPHSWKTLRKWPVMTMYVQPGHYLCLGDNSPESSDGRSWGLVPERLLLGRAVLVYYPFYFPWWPLGAPVNRVGLIK
jgi:signal peptidase I